MCNTATHLACCCGLAFAVAIVRRVHVGRLCYKLSRACVHALVGGDDPSCLACITHLQHAGAWTSATQHREGGGSLAWNVACTWCGVGMHRCNDEQTTDDLAVTVIACTAGHDHGTHATGKL